MVLCVKGIGLGGINYREYLVKESDSLVRFLYYFFLNGEMIEFFLRILLY